MELKDLAPWIAIAFTLALSILVPLFTQIANNSHQRKMQREQFEHEEKQKKTKVFEGFLSEVGGVITANGYGEKAVASQAGAAIHQLYLYAPEEWRNDMDKITGYIMNYDWNKALPLVQKLSRLISDELKKH